MQPAFLGSLIFLHLILFETAYGTFETIYGTPSPRPKIREEFTVAPGKPVRKQLTQLMKRQGPDGAFQFEALKHLDLRGVKISDDDLIWIFVHFPHLESLNLKNQSELSDYSLSQISRLPDLKHLDLSGTKIKQEELESLQCGHSNLKIYSTSHSEKLLNQPDSTLDVILSYQRTPHYASADRRLHSMVKKLKAYQAIGQDPYEFDAKIPLLTQLCSFLEKEASPLNSNLSPEIRCKFKPGNLQILNLRTFHFLEDEIIWIAKHFPVLTSLDLNNEDRPYGHPQLRQKGYESLEQLTKLITLDIGGLGIPDRWIDHVVQLKNLTFLGLSEARLSDDGIGKIANLKDLKCLNLTRVGGLTDQAIGHLKGLPRLSVLYLEQVPITDSAIPDLTELKELILLDLQYTKINASGLAHLVKLEKLESLQINGLIPKAPHSLTGLTHLKSLTLDGKQLDTIGVKFLRKLPALTHIHVPFSGIRAERRTRWRPEQYFTNRINKLNKFLEFFRIQRGELKGVTIYTTIDDEDPDPRELRLR